ncbi:MAG: hypothetical protein N2203_01905 [Bacteroidia bacterium]|nr:hypothetical protein [Bacteroidia bacterium]
MKQVLFLLISLIISASLSAQTGGKKREHRNQRGGGFHLFKKSRGNAGAFAKGHNKQKKGFLARLFSGEKVTAGGWIYHKTPGTHKTDHSLFHRFRTKNKVFKDKLQARINKQRMKNRKRGNVTFSKRKY